MFELHLQDTQLHSFSKGFPDCNQITLFTRDLNQSNLRVIMRVLRVNEFRAKLEFCIRKRACFVYYFWPLRDLKLKKKRIKKS